MTVAAGTVYRPTNGRGGSVVVRSATATQASAAPWPHRARARVTLRQVALTADGGGLAGYVATNQRG
jgi:hypothetical protein